MQKALTSANSLKLHRLSFGRRRHGPFRPIGRSVFLKISYGLYRVIAATEKLGQARRSTLSSCRQALPAKSFKAAKVEVYRASSRPSAGRFCRDDCAPIRSPRRCRAMTFHVPLFDGDHVTDDTGTGFVHTAPSHGRDDFDIWMANKAATRRARHRHAHPLYGRCRWLLHQGSAGVRGQPRHRRQGQQGRCQRGGHQGADRSRQSRRARTIEAPISAFLALEKAAHLPQHAAMVYCDG